MSTKRNETRSPDPHCCRPHKVTAIVPALEVKHGRIHPSQGIVPPDPRWPAPTYHVVDGKRIRRMTIQEADAEQAERVARATNTAPVDPAPFGRTPAGASVPAIAIGDATGLKWRGKPTTVLGRLWRVLFG